MTRLLQQWAKRFNALSQRERIILAIAAVVVVGILWLEFIYLAQAGAGKAIRTRIEAADSEIIALNQQITAFSEEAEQDPDRANRRREKKLREQLARVDEQLEAQMGGLISPTQMAQALEAVLTQKTDLELIGVRNLPIQPLLELPSDAERQSAESGVYRHAMQIEFSGTYLSTLDYLKALQELDWDFYWDSLQLQTESYPVSKVTLTVHTLSLKEGWIGV
ncbi:hypothetical protein [Thiohalophilus thiocyanatoxydans]|uniref:MSHA biogenesis protein MshJ n=1 Tax=Thiohalophilus thiocyanatoxydans TaxID=381308 RepID=A0A4R8ISP8_9GAMM|nr:hypothetical protein [Thiohalophilus thiocyanatoxydans]TDY04072.1 MSHA biogenesis protein MshJ [Thiohalophilus thiocyanatoxydans]